MIGSPPGPQVIARVFLPQHLHLCAQVVQASCQMFAESVEGRLVIGRRFHFDKPGEIGNHIILVIAQSRQYALIVGHVGSYRNRSCG